MNQGEVTRQHNNNQLYVGINIASGGVYLGAVQSPDAVLADDQADRILPNEDLDYPARLEDFRARLAQEFRRLQPATIGIARTRKYAQWSMAEATKHFGLEAAAMIAAVQEGFDCHLITQESAAKSVGVDPKDVVGQLPDRLGIERTHHWERRSVAFMVAVHLAKEKS